MARRLPKHWWEVLVTDGGFQEWCAHYHRTYEGALDCLRSGHRGLRGLLVECFVYDPSMEDGR